MTVSVTNRPYTVSDAAGRMTPLTSVEAQRLLDAYDVMVATQSRVVLKTHSPTQRVTLRPATAGGGPAFVVERAR